MKFSFFREHIENYERRTGLSRKNIRISMVWLWGMLLISIALLKDFRVIILLALIGAVVTLHILIVAKPRKRRTE
mgnify:FL=1